MAHDRRFPVVRCVVLLGFFFQRYRHTLKLHVKKYEESNSKHYSCRTGSFTASASLTHTPPFNEL